MKKLNLEGATRYLPITILILLLSLWPDFTTGQTAQHGSFLTWSPSVVDATHSAAASYNVYRGTAAGAETTLVGTVQASTCTGVPVKCSFIDPVSSLTAGVTYFYIVKAVNSIGSEDGPSNEASAAIPNASGVVLDLADVVK